MMHPNPVINDKIWQKATWRARLIDAILFKRFDDQTLMEMIEAGFHQAHSEGLIDAAEVCKSVANGVKNATSRHVANMLADSIQELDRRNKSIHPL